MYIFFDPGEHTGWTKFDEKGDVIGGGTLNDLIETFNFLGELPVGDFKVIGYEIFALYPWKSEAQRWNQFITSQVIGTIRYVTHQGNQRGLNIQIVSQPANVMSMGYMYAGMNPPSNSNPLRHQLSAFAHGMYWLQKNGIRRPQQGRKN